MPTVPRGGVASARDHPLLLIPVAVLLGLIPAWIAARKGEPFGWWWLGGTAWFGLALPLAVIAPRPGERDPLESVRFALTLAAVVVAVNAAVIIGGWEMVA